MPALILNSKTAQRRRLEKISVFELGRPRARMGNPNTGVGEVLDQPQYDIYFAAQAQALTQLLLFSLPQGSTYNFMGVTAFAKGQGHTSLTRQGQLASSYSFIIRAISVFCTGLQTSVTPGKGYLHIEDANNFLGSYMELDVNQKPWWQGIGYWLPGGGGAMQTGVGTLTAAAATSSTVNGWPVVNNMNSLAGGIPINPQENFAFTINPTINAGGAPSMLATVLPSAGAPAAGLSAWVRLDGTLIRVA